jgi:hypothetical protein
MKLCVQVTLLAITGQRAVLRVQVEGIQDLGLHTIAPLTTLNISLPFEVIADDGAILADAIQIAKALR